ncbi:hypothetical protein K0M31_003922 [Melipona bicolor]|uniref:Uncharacterized protein n=1 Tax=Melipona bicolor TaxID=60889 RepID=A0AA40KNY1_9HYME|nr:hypothetical protein K0M31_003922 [Melipona bicolor]
MSPYVNHSQNAYTRMPHARCTQTARGSRKGSCIQRGTERDRTIPEALHSLQRSADDDNDDDNDDDDDDENDEDDDEVQRRRSRLLAVYMLGEQATRQPTRKALSAETT